MDSRTNLASSIPLAHRDHEVDDWEEWEDDQAVALIDAAGGEQAHVRPPPQPAARQARTAVKPHGLRVSRLSTAKTKRLRSRQRQKAQNAKAGIRLITDMTVFKRNTDGANRVRPPNGRPVKYMDAVALRALEGEPSSASVGNWSWLKKDKDKSHGPDSATPRHSAASLDQENSSETQPMVNSFSIPSKEASARESSPQTATVETFAILEHAQVQGRAAVVQVAGPTPGPNPSSSNADISTKRSVWSPDTPNTAHSFNCGVASSMYSQAALSGLAIREKPPPVPALPANYRKTPQQRLISLDLGGGSQDKDDSGTPCMLFEEDGAPTHLKKHTLGKGLGTSRGNTHSGAHGWWDYVVTPFLDNKFSFSSRMLKVESPKEAARSTWSDCSLAENPVEKRSKKAPVFPVNAPIVREPTPRTIPSPRPNIRAQTTEASKGPSSQASRRPMTGRAVPGKQHLFVTEDVHRDQPPPYTPPRDKAIVPMRYRAVFPPGHPLQAQFPPSPHPASPGFAATMTSQGATQMSNMPLGSSHSSQDASPSSVWPLPLPTRPLGTYLPQDHAHAATGRARKAERKRRRHEKEEVIARRLGGAWRGRGCMPEAGCFGRSGREGRKRRRVWMAIWATVISLLVFMVVLAVVLTRHLESPEAHSIWVNLTDFPPMPTGVLTVVGPDKITSRSVCTEPSTLWSCSLPKDQQDAVAPYRADQPTVIMQIQWNNSTQNTWKSPEAAKGGAAQGEMPRRGLGAVASASGVLGERQTVDGFRPEPSAPDVKEMWFLGNTTDNVRSESKAGEPTPFYISLLKSANDTTNLSGLTPRGSSAPIGNESLAQLLPAPDLEADGTVAPAVMLPNPVQQPVRLFDRGLPTEHYGFYTYFKRSIFLRSVTVLNKTNDNNIPLDEDGGCRKNEADYVVTWSEARVLVQIWTRALDLKTSLLLTRDESHGMGGTRELMRPGTMPYPVTVTLDTHGGNRKKKLVWEWPIDKRQKVDVAMAKLLVNNMGVGGTWINPRETGDPSMGGFDGGTGGCKCEWANWVDRVP